VTSALAKQPEVRPTFAQVLGALGAERLRDTPPPHVEEVDDAEPGPPVELLMETTGHPSGDADLREPLEIESDTDGRVWEEGDLDGGDQVPLAEGPTRRVPRWLLWGVIVAVVLGVVAGVIVGRLIAGVTVTIGAQPATIQTPGVVLDAEGIQGGT